MHVACIYGHLDIVALLLRAGADPDARDRDGRTPLEVACGESKSSTVPIAAAFERRRCIVNASALLRAGHARLGADSPAVLIGSFPEVAKFIVASVVPPELLVKVPELP